MTLLRNRHWINLDGEPVTGRVPPQVIVYGPRMTGRQQGEVAHIYKLFTDVCLVAVGEYQVRNRRLADGTRVRCTSFMGQDKVEVWTAEKGGCALETLFFGAPSSETKPDGEGERPTAVWVDYPKHSEPPTTLDPFSTLEDRPGPVTWSSNKVKLRVPPECGTNHIKPLVVSWRGPAHRYGGYGATQYNNLSFADFAETPRLDGAMRPGLSYTGDDQARTPSVWLNGKKYTTDKTVHAAAIREVEGEGFYLFVATVAEDNKIEVFKAPISLTPSTLGSASVLALELVSVVQLPPLSFIWQSPYFNASATEVTFIAHVYRDEYNTSQSQVFTANVDTGVYTDVFKGLITTTITGGSNSGFATFEETRLNFPAFSVIENYAVPLASDYIEDELVYLYYSVDKDYGHEAGTSFYRLTQSGDRTETVKEGPLTDDFGTYFIYAVEDVNTIAQTLENSPKQEHAKVVFRLLSNIDGQLYEKEVSHTVQGGVSAALTTVTTSSHDEKRYQGESTGEIIEGTATSSTAYSRSFVGSGGSFYLDGIPKIGLVAGDLRHKTYVLSFSGFDMTVEETFSLAPEETDWFIVQTSLVYYIPATRSASAAPKATASSWYAIVMDGTVVYESAIRHLVPPVYLAPASLPDEGGYVTTPFEIGPVGSRVYTDDGYTNSWVTTDAVVEYPMMTPVTQPVTAMTNPAARNFSTAFNLSLESHNANNQPGEYARIAFAPLDADRESVFGYIGWRSPPGFDSNGNPLPRVAFEKFYIENGGPQTWFDAGPYIEGSGATIAGALFVGTTPLKD